MHGVEEAGVVPFYRRKTGTLRCEALVDRRVAEDVLEGKLVISDAAAFRGLSTHISVHGTMGTVCRKPRNFTGAKATCLGDMEITWENLPLDFDLDYCHYWGIPYRQNNSHEDPNSV